MVFVNYRNITNFRARVISFDWIYIEVGIWIKKRGDIMKGKSKHRRFEINSQSEYKKVYRFYPYFLYFRLDKWLKSMSKKGWHIVHSGLFYFLFEKGEPKEREYFSYGEITHEGRYSITLRHPFLEKVYGVDKKKSVINSNKEKRVNIVEIDTDKISGEKAYGYRELVSDRNRLSLSFFLRNAFAILICVIVLILLKAFAL